MSINKNWNNLYREIISFYKKYIDHFFDSRAAGIYMILFAAVIGVATFIENDFGTSAAQKVVFKTWWFELILLLFSLSILANVWRFKMLQRRRWSTLLFHLAIIFILIGAGVTRYFGYEGIMHIRENDVSNSILSSETYLKFEVEKQGKRVKFDEQVLFASLGNNNFEESYLVGEDLIDFRVKRFIPNPVQQLQDSENGYPVVQIVLSGNSGREEYFIQEGESKVLRNLRINFTGSFDENAVNIFYENDSLFISSSEILTQMVMATQDRDTLYPYEGPHSLKLRSLYSDGINNFVFSVFNPKGAVEIVSASTKVKNESLMAILAEVTVNGISKEIYIPGKKGFPGSPVPLNFGDLNLSLSFGAKSIVLPFHIRLYDFIMERYPGTNSAASYASEVQLIDDRNDKKMNYRIFMNNILTYGGYRFFQSSFDKDEKGTYLSVNHDFWGTWISYVGYFLFTLGLVMAFFSKNGRFYYLSQMIKKMRSDRTFILLVLIYMGSLQNVYAQKEISPLSGIPVIDLHHSELFSNLVVQDINGRMKPMHTMTRELMRKIARTESLYGMTADQIILSMYADNQIWINIPLIKLGKHTLLRDQLEITGDYAMFSDFFNENDQYILRDEVRMAYDLQPIDRGTYEKELMKIDERVNIANMIFTGRIFKIIPIPEDPNNTWLSTAPSGTEQINIQNFSTTASRFFTSYQPNLHDALRSNDYSAVNQLLEELSEYQINNGGDIVPSPARLQAEIFLNKLNVFGRMSIVYTMLGLAFLVLLFSSIFKPDLKLAFVFKMLVVLVFAGFLFHTLGLGLRWYVSGRAPWSNGYESMIYIAWTTTLAGILFTRKFAGGLAATMILAGTILLVAQLSYLDPEITPLVPVLRSYWLTIHVSLVAGSYGFLMLGAIIGLINLILMMFLAENNKTRIAQIVKEMTFISEMTLMGGLFMLAVGTYLGGIWANESWGRYWGWDAKETWALVTILVYAFILHMRFIPKLKSLYVFSLATLFGWASVIMTYFGVNYYLSGLHSYAAGDPIPIPSWVYISVVAAIFISIIASIRTRKIPVAGMN